MVLRNKSQKSRDLLFHKAHIAIVCIERNFFLYVTFAVVCSELLA